MEGPKQSPLSVTAYPAAWRVEVADDSKHRGFEYIRSGQTLFDTLKRFTDTA